MPAHPTWLARIPLAIEELRALPRPFVDRPVVETLLGVGRRRAQQIMAPCVADRVGSSGIVDRETLIRHLETIASGDAREFEIRRRRKVASLLDQLRNDRTARPHLLVEAPVRVVSQQIEDLPSGIHIEPGRILVEFAAPQEALEKLLALAMAISNDFDEFQRAVEAR